MDIYPEDTQFKKEVIEKLTTLIGQAPLIQKQIYRATSQHLEARSFKTLRLELFFRLKLQLIKQAERGKIKK